MPVAVATRNHPAKRLRTDWDLHRTPKGVLYNQLGENHPCHLQADIALRQHNCGMSLVSLTEE